ncbi:glycosyltransferase family 2 protein [Polaribacter sp. IC073]|uniref:glycosyltransferase family 2 protein n=1 Tax=Polaribacter sp. IC073 TaxID=2508540 RepID=UPI0011BFA651|nr:glycosyltransferase family 2 protein [Polaribacter sp. IC073]TXD49131.1 glycosyltransferase family 2 protein [Polaribacter sp. IC073]
MIILFHNGIKPLKYLDLATKEEFSCTEKTIQKSLFKLSTTYPKELLIWCNLKLKSFINYSEIKFIFQHELILASYGINKLGDVSSNIGYVDQHCFINVKKEVQYPTWIMSGDIGGTYASIIQQSKEIITLSQPFGLYLSSLAKLSMPKGLFCYSAPMLLKGDFRNIKIKADSTNKLLFKFVKRHYKIQWIFILFFCLMYYQHKIYLASLCTSLFAKKLGANKINFKSIHLVSTKSNITKEDFTVDVLIPTLGRKEHLKNVLKDLSKQTLLPEKVIIVEQNGLENSVSELDYLNNNWPFKIDHTFIHQLGACNARNIALSKVTSNWVFFADDDIRFEKDLLDKSLEYINMFGASSITISCLQEGELENNKTHFQWSGFGTNASFVENKYIYNCSFKSEHEFGYGEDNDFGMQLRNKGCENLYIPYIKMLHLKAPIGGFRAKIYPEWEKEIVVPKPSPTVMAYNLKHLTKEQLDGYKFLLFVKFYKKQHIKNPVTYYKSFKKRWNMSVKWATKLMKYEV